MNVADLAAELSGEDGGIEVLVEVDGELTTIKGVRWEDGKAVIELD